MTYTGWTRDEILHLLRDSQGTKSLTQFANDLGVSKQYLSNVFNGHDDPSDRLLENFGYTRGKPVYIQIPKQEKKAMSATATKIGCAHCPAEFDTMDELRDHAAKDHADKLRRPDKHTKQSTSTLVSVILDKSGSMSTKVQDVIGGFNTYVDELRKQTEVDFRFTLTLFDTDFVEKYLNEPLSSIKHLNEQTYQPGGSTALNDAIGRTVQLIAGDKPEGKVIVVIMTDGEENSSHEYTTEAVKSLIQQKEKDGWAFVFLGASPDVWQQGMGYGIAAANIAQYDPGNYQGTFVATAHATSSSATGAAPMHACFAATPDSMLKSANLRINPNSAAIDNFSGGPFNTPPPAAQVIPVVKTPRRNQAWTKTHSKSWNKRK